MKYVITIMLMLATLAVWGQKTTTNSDFIRAKDNLRVGENTIQEFEQDTALTSDAHTHVPTSKAVREFVFNWITNVDTFYLAGDSLYLLTSKDTFIVDVSEIGPEGMYINNDSLCLITSDTTYCVDLIDYLQDQVTDFSESGDTLYLVVGATTYEVPISAGIQGSGSVNYLPKWTPSGSQLGNSQVFDNSTQVSINVYSGMTAKFTVRSNTSSNAAIAAFERYSAQKAFTVYEDGTIAFGDAGNKPWIYPFVNSTPSTSDITGQGLGFNSRWGNQSNATGFYFANIGNFTATSGTTFLARFQAGFAPTSGSGAYRVISIAGIVNQSGGANGPTRGVYVGPTLTSAPNWASFHADHTSGIGFLQTGAAANRFSGKLKVGADADPLRNVDVAGTIRVSSSVDSAAMQRIWAGNTQGDMRFAKLGTNLSFAGDTLNATGGGGIPYDTTVTPSAKLVALNATQDTFTDLHGDIYDYESSLGAFYTLKNTRIQNDTLITHRGSFAQGYKTSRYSKTIAGNDNDTLNINANTALYDFEQSGGEFTHVIGPEEHYLLPGTSGTIKVFTVNVQVSLSSAVAAASNLGVYQNGNSTACFAEFTMPGGDEKQSISLSCIIPSVSDGDVFTVQLGNDESTPRTYILERSTFSMYHIKNKIIPGF